jgi:hypothetical protein
VVENVTRRGNMRIAYRILGGKHRGKRSLGRLRCEGRIAFKI